MYLSRVWRPCAITRSSYSVPQPWRLPLAWNLTVVCNFHHDLIHKKHIGVKGRAPHALEWTPPKLMQAVLDRRRNRPSIWLGELDVREWSLESRAPPAPADT